MRALCLSAMLLAAAVSAAAAQTPAPAAVPAPAVKLTPKEIADLQARLSSLDREMGREWIAISLVNSPGASMDQKNDMASRLVKDGSLVVMRPLSPKHEALQIQRAEVEAKLLAAGQKVRNMSKYAQEQYGVTQTQRH